MARVKVTMEDMRREFAAHGVTLLNTDEYVNTDQRLYFSCTKCGKPYFTTRRLYRKGRNPNFLCKECNIHAPKDVAALAKEFAEKGSTLLTTEIKNVEQKVEFTCSKCGAVHSIRLANYFSQGSRLLCPKCISENSPSKKSQDFIVAELKKRKATLLSEYIGCTENFLYKCDLCGRKGSDTWSRIRDNVGEDRPLCPKCAGLIWNPTYEEIKEWFESKGVQLLSTEYLGQEERLEFACINCGERTSTTWKALRQNKHLDFLCSKCHQGQLFNPEGLYGRSRNSIDNLWLGYIREFYNVGSEYASHHIHPWMKYPEERLSLTNGYPLLREYHSAGFEWGGKKNPFHTLPELMELKNWPDFARWNSYTGPLVNLGDIITTQIIWEDPEESLVRQKERNNRIFPIFYDEMADPDTRQIIYSMLRTRISKSFPQVYEMTGCKPKKFHARQLEVRKVPSQVRQAFYLQTHIQGDIPAKECYGLYLGEELIAAMSFGISRVPGAEWELYRFSTLLNTLVVGGASKLFKAFIQEMNPDSVVSFCDIRLCTLNPEDTLYPKLGFSFEGKTRPNYFYIPPGYATRLSRQQFQKHKLKNKLRIFDPSISEKENMLANGYSLIHDCGSYKFIWKRG